MIRWGAPAIRARSLPLAGSPSVALTTTTTGIDRPVEPSRRQRPRAAGRSNRASTIRMSGRTAVATANARRIYMPLEYRFTGVSRNFSTSENLTMSSNSTAFAPSDAASSRSAGSRSFVISSSAAAVTISGLEMLQNSGKEAIIDLMDGLS